MRILAIPLLVALVLTLPAESAATDSEPVRPTGVAHALAVLHGWDERRARVWAGSDQQALVALYVRGSAAGRADLRLLRSYTARGFVVRRLLTQVFGLRVVEDTPTRLVVRVLDRVAGGEVTTPDGAVPLPSTRPVVRRVVLVRRSVTWRVVEVSDWD